MRSVLPISVLALSVPLTAAGAQQLGEPRFDAALFEAPPVMERVEPFAPPGATATAPGALPPGVARAELASPAARSAARSQRRGGFTWRDVAHTVGGALIGGWLGYVGSQVIKDDWEKDSNGALKSHRSMMTAAGALVGVLGSRLIGDTDPPVDGLTPTATPRPDRTLTFEQIQDSQAPNAYELIATLRPQWLVLRGVNSHSEASQGFGSGETIVVRPGADRIIVYVNDHRIGGVGDMREIPREMLTGARFLDAREATYRFGAGHTHGAILLSTEAPSS